MYKITELCGESYRLSPECKLDVYLPDRDPAETPLYIHFHGGGLESGSRRDRYVIELAEKYGIAVASADYRMYPKAKFPDFIEDAAVACAYVMKKMEGKYKTVIVGGSSAGAYLSMMLYFAPDYLAAVGLRPEDFGGFIFDAGQPTTHFNVLRERGLDSRAIRADEASPMYFLDRTIPNPAEKPPVLILNAENDMENRREQTMLLMGVMKTFGYDMNKVKYVLMDDCGHCEYCSKRGADGEVIVNPILAEFIGGV
ncbi:MAG: alpha/beta hydrolase [Clostridia bacterium]|nr:alpha/beta hydrolase [Clostridia bacterium]